MERTWIVVADSAHARILEATGRSQPLTEIETLEHPPGRLREHDLASDRPGYSSDRQGHGRHAVNQDHGHHHEQEVFARVIAGRLTHAHQQQRFARLILAAPPAFLGALRQQLNGGLDKLVARTLDKNLVQHNSDQLHKTLFG